MQFKKSVLTNAILIINKANEIIVWIFYVMITFMSRMFDWNFTLEKK